MCIPPGRLDVRGAGVLLGLGAWSIHAPQLAVDSIQGAGCVLLCAVPSSLSPSSSSVVPMILAIGILQLWVGQWVGLAWARRGTAGTNQGMLSVELCRHGNVDWDGAESQTSCATSKRDFRGCGAGIVVCRWGVVVVVCLSTATDTVNDHTHTHVQ